MINMEWSSHISVGERAFDIASGGEMHVSDHHFFLDGDRIPFIACFSGLDHLRTYSIINMIGPPAQADVLMEIFRSGGEITTVSMRGARYLVGKGILLDTDRTVLAMLTVTKEFYANFRYVDEVSGSDINEHFNLILHQKFIRERPYRTIYSKFKQELLQTPINVQTTWDTHSQSFVKKHFPRFRTIDQRRAFALRVTSEVIENVLIRQVI
jgi:hypothetical protein